MQSIIAQLQSFSAPNVFNPWRDTDPLDCTQTAISAPAARQFRLIDHFNCNARFLLIGEAPGYQGCKFSGIPFTNEKLLLDGAVPRVTWNTRITTRRLPWSEPAATIMWRTLHALQIADCTVMANAFSFHPYRPGNVYSNRAPTNTELVAGRHVLSAILEHFNGARVIAVGKVAERALTLLSVRHEAVRHPSMGGAFQFATGMRRIVKESITAARGLERV